MYTLLPLKVALLVIAIITLEPAVAFAHQPRLVEGRQTVVESPEVSKAYYGTLSGIPDTYVIHTATPIELYVGVLVPDIQGQKKDVSAAVFKDGVQIATLDGVAFQWTQFYEPFGADTYWKGPEYKARVGAGEYEIRVWSSNNDSKYSLAVGELEVFNANEIVNALTLIPTLKSDFFHTSPASFLYSPMGIGYLAIVYACAFMFGFIYRWGMKRFAKNTVRRASRNIDTSGRIYRLAIGAVLLVWAVTTTWNPIILFISGFTIFEALFRWCGLFAALGKSTCPVE